MSLQSIKSSRSLRLTLRFVVPLVAAMALLAYAVVPLVDKLTLRWSVRDMDIRSKLVTSTLQEPLGELLEQGNKKRFSPCWPAPRRTSAFLRWGTATFREICSSKPGLFPTASAVPFLILLSGKPHRCWNCRRGWCMLPSIPFSWRECRPAPWCCCTT